MCMSRLDNRHKTGRPSCRSVYAVAQSDEAEPGTQIHVRGIGVDGWDGSPEGLSPYESEAALKTIFEQYGKFLQATIRHRIEGPSGKWDPKI